MAKTESVLRCETPLGPVVRNVGVMLRDRARGLAGRVAYREKRGGSYRELAWRELYDKVARAGSALLGLGVSRGDVLATYSRNREEMLVFELSAMSVGAVACPIFSEYPSGPLDYVLAHSGAKILLVSDEARLAEVAKTGSRVRLERVFLMEGGAGAQARPFRSLLEAAASPAFEEAAAAPEPGDACLLMYTSGTTGRPKGVLLSHGNVLSQRKALELLWGLGPDDRFLAYLPWHHSFGGIFELFGALYSGGCLTLDESYGKDVPLLVENFRRVRPTVYFSVPSIYKALVAEAQRSKELEAEILHPELKFVFTAAAPLPASLAEYFASKGVPVVEGWGLTETSPCVTVTRPGEPRRAGLVGLPLPGVEASLAPNGEILVRGPNVMLGYLKDPERNARVLDAGGWFHTGDFGELAEDGLMLKGRLDGMFKLSSGQMVLTQDVENALASTPLIRFAVAFGSGEDFVVALVFPDRKALAELGARGAEVLAEEVRRASQAISEKYARPRAVVVADEDPGLANGQLTPTMKVVRHKVLERYARQVEAVFARGKSGAPPQGGIVWL